jgi:toxin HigB-1
MIRSFRGKFAQAILAERRAPKGFLADLLAVARRKLLQLNAAGRWGTWPYHPANRLEALKGDLRGCYSIRVNDQWRIVFRWSDTGPEDVQMLDYH